MGTAVSFFSGFYNLTVFEFYVVQKRRSRDVELLKLSVVFDRASYSIMVQEYIYSSHLAQRFILQRFFSFFSLDASCMAFPGKLHPVGKKTRTT